MRKEISFNKEFYILTPILDTITEFEKMAKIQLEDSPNYYRVIIDYDENDEDIKNLEKHFQNHVIYLMKNGQ